MVSLTPYNTLHLPAKAKNLIEIKTLADIKKLPKEDLMFLGHGANVLFKNNFPGTIALVRLSGRNILQETTESVLVEIGAGESWHDFVTWAVNNNLSGIENIAFVPGTIGAAAIGNIAAYGQNQEDVFVSLKAVNLTTGKTEELSKTDMQFGYRDSIFKHNLHDYFVTSVTYKLSKTAHLELSYHATRHASLLPELIKIKSQKDEVSEANRPQRSRVPSEAKETGSSRTDLPDASTFTIHDVYQAVINLRTSKLPDPKKIGTAGSFFKNPLVTKDVYLSLKSQVSDLQSYPPEKLSYSDDLTDYVKIPAGRLLDELGWRGKRIGNVGTYPTHALTVVTYPGATGTEVWEFSEMMRADLKKNFNIDLEYEVVIV